MLSLRLEKEKAINPDTTDEHLRTPGVTHVINQLRQNHVSRNLNRIYCHRLNLKYLQKPWRDEKYNMADANCDALTLQTSNYTSTHTTLETCRRKISTTR